MPQKQDKRVHHTIHALQTALIALLQQKSMSQVSVRELCDTAGINRSTFYVYYKCIDELMEEIEAQAFDHLESIFQRERSGAMQIQRSMEYVRDNKELFRIIFRQGSCGAMKQFSELMHRQFISSPRSAGWRPDTPEKEYLYDLVYTGTMGMIQKWLDKDCLEEPQRLAEIVWKTIVFCENQKNFGNPIAF